MKTTTTQQLFPPNKDSTKLSFLFLPSLLLFLFVLLNMVLNKSDQCTHPMNVENMDTEK